MLALKIVLKPAIRETSYLSASIIRQTLGHLDISDSVRSDWDLAGNTTKGAHFLLRGKLILNVVLLLDSSFFNCSRFPSKLLCWTGGELFCWNEIRASVLCRMVNSLTV